MIERIRLDDTTLVVGAGLAGLFLALKLAPRRVVVLSPAPLGTQAASAWAQGGLAAALGPEDDPAQHAADTIAAGAGLVDPGAAHLLANEGPARVLDLLQLGVPFDTSEGGALALSLEAAHSRPRVARVKGDLAGRAIMDALIAAAGSADHIDVREGLTMVDLLHGDTGVVTGVLCRRIDGAIVALEASETVLAVGGLGGLFRITTNPGEARGDALAAAYRAGALIADPEFMQFHPTAIDVGVDPAPLATEALRGEGAVLVNASGRRFMMDYDYRGDLAPRDVVARAIDVERAAGRGAFLDARTTVGSHFPDQFPTVYAACRAAGVDPRTAPIPVAPAAHYHMGGVATDLWARTSSVGLSAIGECACTGAHGANRLASNSLLEAVVFAHRLAERLRQDPASIARTSIASAAPPPRIPAETLIALRAHMSANAGVVRSEQGLASLESWICAAIEEHGAANPLVAARLLVSAARARKESRGGHYREDFPGPSSPQRTFVQLPSPERAA